jgi:hypothetical protein
MTKRQAQNVGSAITCGGQRGHYKLQPPPPGQFADKLWSVLIALENGVMRVSDGSVAVVYDKSIDDVHPQSGYDVWYHMPPYDPPETWDEEEA